ncbi:hypothetical protein Ato02nite_036720 [Paractinoplanes toevensis]|uniref:Uncharacterized protein n=1 Tax=Paractinoplanes toevensis TaxID=571911 RepID=A0A919W2Q3_9ACTN|nr:hypothetical protein Ato02nite_036720 [Actinoplanes toevensis]
MHLTLPRKLLALTITAVTGAALLSAPAYAGPDGGAPKPGKPATEKIKDVPTKLVDVAARVATKVPSALDKPAPVWPAAGASYLDLKPAETAVGGLSVQAEKKVANDPGRVRLEVFDRAATEKAAVRGVLMRMDRADGRAGAGNVQLTVDYAPYATAYGADWASRLRLVQLPTCALDRPEAAECAGKPLATKNDTKAKTVSALATTGSLVAVAAGKSGPAGDYSATSLQASSTWTAGGNTGAFTWSYPMRVPPSLGGPTPTVDLSYSSQSVDGRHAASNNQPSWVGEGFEAWPGGYIERTYTSCGDDRDGDQNNNDDETGDNCWETDNATLSLNGSSGELLYNSTEKRWHLRSEDGSKIERRTGATNGDNDGEWWVVTTTDGTEYWFGRNRLPGWTTNAAETNSAWTVPVFGNEPNEPCHATKFADSDCLQAWRWNLDYVVDLHGNSMSYWYQNEQNRYLRNVDKDDKAVYDRGGWLDHVDYGTRRISGADNYFSGTPPMRVDFAVADRCLSSCTTKDETHWPDVPWDQECTAAQTDCDNYAPTFWSTKRLSTITTQVRKSGALSNVDRWTLTQSFPDPGDTTRAGLWLDKIQQAGLVGGTATLPEVTFTGVQLANRVDTIDFAAAMNWWRIAKIENESGGTVNVTYKPQDCKANDKPSPATNTRLCYPVLWKPEGYANYVTDWFNKWVVDTVYNDDHTGGVQPQGSPRVVYKYSYLDGAAWHYADDDGLVKAKVKTWSGFRGFARVGVTVGDPGEQTYSETRYFRGMHGDRLNASGGTRSVQIDGINDEDWYGGMERESKTFNGPGGAVVSRHVSDPWASAATATRTFNGDTVTARFVRTATTRDYTTLDNNRGERVTRSTTTYDKYGLAEKIDDYGVESITGDERCTVNDYTPRNEDKWLLANLHRVQNYAVKCADTGGTLTDADVIGETRTSFDGLAFEATPTVGDPTKIETMSAWNAGAPTFVTTGTSTFDEHGRTLVSTVEGGATTTTEYLPKLDGPVTQSTITNALGHQTVSILDPAWGHATATIDPNLKRTDLQHDPMGRLTSVWGPGSVKGTDPAEAKFAYYVRKDAATAISTSKLNIDGTYTTAWALSDGLMRTRQTQASSPSGGRLVTEMFYDSAGRASKTFAAYHTGGTPSGDLITTTERAFVPDQTRTVFDGAGRKVAEIFQPYDKERWRTSTYYAGDRTDTTPANGGTATSTVINARGDNTELREYTAGGTPTPGTAGSWQTTLYKRDRKGQLTDVVDASGNTWTYQYDIRGRETTFTDPDKGKVTTTYDDANRIKTKTDARQKTLAFSYDALNRKRVMFEGAIGGTVRASWTYDTLAKGQLTQSSRMVGSAPYVIKQLGYTDGYQSLGSEYTIPVSETGVAGTYTFRNSYNKDDSLATSSYAPAGGLPLETMKYGWSKFDRATSLTSTYGENTALTYVGETVYNALNLLDQYKLTTGTGNVVWQSFRRELETGRLTGVRIQRDKAAPYLLADKTFTYDDYGNVTSATDVSDAAVTDTQCFTYDRLQRLTEAWTPNTAGNCSAAPAANTLGGPAAYWNSWTFDAVGNRKTMTAHSAFGDSTTNYAYPAAGTARPHAITGTTGATTGSYTYDEMGNTLTRPTSASGTQTLTWDIEGEVESASDTTGKTTFLYDADGNRLIRVDPKGKTLYLPGQEVRYDSTTKQTSCTRYYTFGNSTVASRTEKGLTWLGVDHQGTAQVQIDAATQDYSIRRQNPYGSPRGTNPAWANDKGFVGGTNDNTGLTHLGARLYDQLHGVFLSVDPLIEMNEPRSLNPYTYSWSNPLTFSDPDGQWPGWMKKASNAVTGAVKATGNYLYKNAGTISTITGVLAIVTAPIPGVGAGLGLISAGFGALETGKSCYGGQLVDCGLGVAGLVPGIGTAARSGKAVLSALKTTASLKKAKRAFNTFDAGASKLADGAWNSLMKSSDPGDYKRLVDKFNMADGFRQSNIDYYRQITSRYKGLYPTTGPQFWQIKQMDQFDRWGNMLQLENASWNTVACFKYNDCGKNRHEVIFGGGGGSSGPSNRGGGSGSGGGNNRGNGGDGGSSSPGSPPSTAPSYNFPIPGSPGYGGCQNIKVPGGTLVC